MIVSEVDDAVSLVWQGFGSMTVEQLVKKAGTDTSVWSVDRSRIALRDAPARGDPRQIRSMTVTLKRKVPRSIVNASAELVKQLAIQKVPTLEKNRRRSGAGEYMAELSLYDHHFGKLAWGREVGEDYDLDIARSRYVGAVRDAVEKVSRWTIGSWLLPLGHDFFHIDNPRNETTKGTPQDVDGRWPKIFATGISAVLESIDLMRQVAPVKVVWVPGNHDRVSSWWLVQVIKSRYANATDVTVDDEPTPRKYIEFGCNLIGLTHGDEVRQQDLPAIMATAEPQRWANTTHHEWHLGHFHKRQETRYTAVDTHAGVVVRVLPSLAGTDSWHYSKGYLGSGNCAEMYLWGRTEGYVGHLSVSARP